MTRTTSVTTLAAIYEVSVPEFILPAGLSFEGSLTWNDLGDLEVEAVSAGTAISELFASTGLEGAVGLFADALDLLATFHREIGSSELEDVLQSTTQTS